eukprot:11759107-Prorocentrum_lima.AAC.1
MPVIAWMALLMVPFDSRSPTSEASMMTSKSLPTLPPLCVSSRGRLVLCPTCRRTAVCLTH